MVAAANPAAPALMKSLLFIMGLARANLYPIQPLTTKALRHSRRTRSQKILRGLRGLPDADSHFVAGPIEIGQAHGHCRSGCNARRDANAYLAHAGRDRHRADGEDSGHAAADHDLRWNHAAGSQTGTVGAVDVDVLADCRGIIGCDHVPRAGVKNGALSLSVAGHGSKRGRSELHIW